MTLMLSLSWICIMLLLGVFLRAKVKFFRNILMPASVIGGIVGFICINAGVLWNADFSVYNQITTELFILSFIALGLTGIGDSSGESGASLFKTIIKGSIGISCIWCGLWAITPLIGYSVGYLMSGFTDMHPVYNLLIPTAFCDGPGQALIFGNMFESYGWKNASQVGVIFAVIGFFYAFGVGVPMAKLGIKRGIAKHVEKIDDCVATGLFKQNDTRESLGEETTYSGNIDTLALHLALMGVCYILSILFSKLLALIPGTLGTTLSSFTFMWGLIMAYVVRWLLKKMNLLQYTNDILFTRITGTCTDFLIVSAFMAVQISLIVSWLIPILIVTAISALVTFIACFYFGSRLGSDHDFERTLGIFGTATGTTPTGIALIRIVDPNLRTPAATEIGAMNVCAIPLASIVYVAIPSMAQLIAEGSSAMIPVVACLATLVACFVLLKIFRVWGKPTFRLRK